ncbi:MAG: 30S ribosomal protein S6, partial [Phycisphaerales bacterium]
FGSTFENCESEVRRLMERAQAEVLFLRQWDERRLAYRIKGRKRGVYVLVYFKAEPDRITPLERDAKLAENVLRLLVVRADGITQEMMDKALAARGEIAEDGSPKAGEDSPVAEAAPYLAQEGAEDAAEVDALEPEALVAEVVAEDPPVDEPATDAPLG